MTQYEIRFPNGSVLATEPQDDVPDCLLNGGEWGTGAYKYLQDLQGLSGGRLIQPSIGKIPRDVKKLSRFELTIMTKLIVDCIASSFQQGATQVQIYKGDLKLKWFIRLALWERVIRWFARVFGLRVFPSEDETLIPNATVTLSYPPEPDAIIDGEMEGNMTAPPMPVIQPHLHITFKSQGPSQPRAQSYTFPVKNCVLHGEWDF